MTRRVRVKTIRQANPDLRRLARVLIEHAQADPRRQPSEVAPKTRSRRRAS
jgi:hypothetical protein